MNCAACVALDDAGAIAAAGIACGGLEEFPLRLRDAAEAAVRGAQAPAPASRDAAECLLDISENGDGFRRTVAARLVRDAVEGIRAGARNQAGSSRMNVVHLEINGTDHAVDVEPRTLLVDAIRDGAGLLGTRIGCDSTSCGACTVLLDDRPVKSCTLFAVQAEGRRLPDRRGDRAGRRPSSGVDHAFDDHFAFQCGSCTSGMLMSALAIYEHGKLGRARRSGARWPGTLPLHRLRIDRRRGRSRARRRRLGGGAMSAKHVGTSANACTTARSCSAMSSVADVALPNMLYAAFYRSPHAHAQLKRLDLSPALASEGVVLAITAKELRERVNNMKPFPFQSRDPFRVGNPQIRFHDRVGLADDKVLFVGEPVALIVAESRYLAEDAVEWLVHAEYDVLDPVLDAVSGAAPGAPLLYEEWGDNVTLRFATTPPAATSAAAFEEADVIVERAFSITGSAAPDRAARAFRRLRRSSNSLTVWDSTQIPHGVAVLLENSIRDPADIA